MFMVPTEGRVLVADMNWPRRIAGRHRRRFGAEFGGQFFPDFASLYCVECDNYETHIWLLHEK